MAVTKIKPIKGTLNKALDYIQNPEKTDGKMLVSSFGCSYETADIEFAFTLSQALDKGSNLAHHLIQAFEPGEVDYQTAHEIGRQLADAVTKGQHEYVLTTHIDKGHIHNHIIFCAVNFVDHHKYNSNKRSYYGIRNMSDKLCREHGLSVVLPNRGSKGKSYAEYQAEKTGTSWKGKLKIAVDALIPQVSSFEELLSKLQAAGYEIKQGKYISCRAPGQERFTRLKTLGADYTEEAIRERISGKRARAAKAPRADRGGVSLLIDIQNSIKVQESRGYEQWAKIHNLKQAAKTMNFLTEHKIEQYAELTAKITEVAKASEQAADSLKEVEKRLTDMTLLIKNINTYQKTKPAYAAYRKAKDKEKYRTAHESDIILYEAAAKAIKAAGITKLPSLAALQAEYAALQEQKEALYADYGKLKKQVKEYDVIKKNIDSMNGETLASIIADAPIKMPPDEDAGHPGSVVASFTAQPTADAPVFSQAATAPKSTQPAQQQVQPPVQQSHASAPEPPKTLDEYLRIMTIEQAKAVKVDFGRFSGWSLGEIAMKSPGDLAWYVKNYSGHNLALKAGATKLLETVGQMAS